MIIEHTIIKDTPMQKVKTPDAPSLTTRMKEYEASYNYNFTKRTPLIIRLDGKAFASWTRQLNRPFDERLPYLMGETLKYAMKEIQGCAFAFSVSDEISLFLRDWDKLNTDAWFGNDLQKIVSVASSIVTAKFNEQVLQSKMIASPTLALFDARAFILPKDEVVNYFIYRQHDGIRNSIQMHAQNLLGHRNIKGINNNALKDMIRDEFPDKAWEDIDPIFRNGICLKKGESEVTTDVPLFKDDRQYIEDLIYIKGE